MKHKENKKHIKKIYEKKIYFKNIDTKQLKINILNILKKKFKYKKNKKHYLINDKGIYLFENDYIKRCQYISNIINETNNYIEINQYNKFKENIYQIPFEHKLLTVNTLSFNIDNNILNFELVNNKINDFYVKTNSSLSILDTLLIKEISYIKNLII